MDWKDEIIEGMKLIKKGCEKAHKDMNTCENCPFTDFCDAIILDCYRMPFKWKIENEDN